MTLDTGRMRDLCRRRDAGVVAAAAKQQPLAAKLVRDATPEERQALVDDGQRARQEMIEGNLGLVGFAVSRFLPTAGIERDDCFQEGVIGLARAVDGYDPDRAAFSSFALPHIRGAVMTLTATRGGDLKPSQGRTVGQVDRETERRRQLGLPTTTAEIARSLHMTEAAVTASRAYRRPSTLTAEDGSIGIVDNSGQTRIDGVGRASASSYLFMLPANERRGLLAVHSDEAAGRTMSETAADLGYNTRQLRRIVNSGHRHLRALMARDEHLDISDTPRGRRTQERAAAGAGTGRPAPPEPGR